MSFLGMTRNSLGTRHWVTKKKISQGSCIIIHSTSAYLFSVLFLCFVVFIFQFSSSSFFMVSHDLRMCFLELVHYFFRSANLYSLVHPHFLGVRGINNWKKSKMAAGGMSFAGKVALITGTFWAFKSHTCICNCDSNKYLLLL